MMRCRFFPAVVSALLVLASLLRPGTAHCGNRSLAEPTRLKVVLLPYLSFAVFSIAAEEGYFAEQNLEIEFVKMDRVFKGIPALARGQLDVLAGATSISFLNAVAKGADIRIVADKGQIATDGCGSTYLMARRSLVERDGLEDLSQLRGRRVVVLPKAYNEYLINKILAMDNLGMGDIEAVNMPYPVLSEAFRKSSIDAAIVSEPWVTRILKDGQAINVIAAKEVTPGYQRASIFYGPNLLRKNPDAGERFMVAYLKAVRTYREGKTARNIEIVAKHTGLDADFAGEICWVPFREDGRINIESVLDFQSWALREGYVEESLTVGQVWEPRFVEKASRVLQRERR